MPISGDTHSLPAGTLATGGQLSDPTLHNNNPFTDLSAGLTEALGRDTVHANSLTPHQRTEIADILSLIANVTLTYASGITSGHVLRTRKEGVSYTVAVSGASDHHITTAGGLKLYVNALNGTVIPEQFGAIGDGVADDTAAMAKFCAFSSHGVLAAGKTYTTTLPLVVKGKLSGAGRRAYFDGTAEFTSVIKATAPMEQLVILTGNGGQIDGFLLNGNRMSNEGITMNAANATQITNCAIEYNLRNGIRPGSTGNNNGVSIKENWIRYNGTIYECGTTHETISTFNLFPIAMENSTAAPTSRATTTAASTLVTCTNIDFYALNLRADEAMIWITGDTQPRLIDDIVSATSINVFPAVPSALADATFIIMSGCGIMSNNHTDNQVWQISTNNITVNAVCGLFDRSLYGAYSQNNIYQYGGVCGVIIGRGSDVGATYRGVSERDYFEFFGFPSRKIWLTQCDQYRIVLPMAVIADEIYTENDNVCEYTYVGEVETRRWKETTNPGSATTLSANGPQRHAVRGSPSASPIEYILPEFPANRGQPETYEVCTGNLNGRSLLLKAAGAATVNTQAGSTGIPYRGSNKRLVASWSENSLGWVVTSASAMLYGSAVHDFASVAANSISAALVVPVVGASLNDVAQASLSISTSGLFLTAHVTSTGNVTVYAVNMTGAAIDLASATVNVVVTDMT